MAYERRLGGRWAGGGAVLLASRVSEWVNGVTFSEQCFSRSLSRPVLCTALTGAIAVSLYLCMNGILLKKKRILPQNGTKKFAPLYAMKAITSTYS